MANLPSDYSWLNKLSPLPRMMTEAIAEYGTVELQGAANSPRIMRWATEVSQDVRQAYYADSVPWCGLFMAVVAQRAGKTPPAAPLWALNWVKFGEPAGQPALGDTLVFVRPGGGHVGLYVGEDSKAYHVLGGNQSDKVCIASIKKERLHAARRPLYMNRPSTVKPYILASTGSYSNNEA